MNKLDVLRLAIDQTDKEIVQLLEERFKLVREIGKFKKEKKVPILDVLRENEILKSKQALLKNEDNWPAVMKIFECIMAISKELQK